MLSRRTCYVLRRLSGIILYGLAYTALWPGLTLPVVTIRGNSLSPSSPKIGVGNGDEFLEPMTRSTIDLVIEMFKSHHYFPCFVIFLFSVVSPGIKLLVILYGEVVGNIFRIEFDDTSKIVDLRKGLRVIAKYQCVDVFVTIITRQLLSSDFIACDIESGFYFFCFYSFSSILAAQLCDTLPPNTSPSSCRRLSKPSTPSGELTPVSNTPTPSIHPMSWLNIVLQTSSLLMFLTGLVWSLGFPILSVKFLFQSKIVVGESVASLLTFISLPPSHSPTDVFCAALVCGTCVAIPVIVVLLSVIGRAGNFVKKLTNVLTDWALLDVFGVALLTSLFAFASFASLRASAPWGFYAVLMAAMSAYELGKTQQVTLTQPSGAYTRLDGDGLELPTWRGDDAVDEENMLVEEASEGSSGSLSRRRVSTTGEKLALPSFPARISGSKRSRALFVVATIIRRLGLPFFILKALGWAVFFLIWFMNSGSGSLDLFSLSETLRSNAPLVTSSLREALPSGMGMCSDLANVSGAGGGCIEKPYMYYEKNTAYEVLARWLSGFRSVTVRDVGIAVPESGKFELTVRGEFDQIQLSLFIGQCLGSIFSGSNSTTSIPACGKLFDKIHSWKSVAWTIEIEAECHAEPPYVRNITVDRVSIDSEIKLEQEIAFGVSLPLQDISSKFKVGIRESIQPLLQRNDGWIPWGSGKFTLSGLLSRLVQLNTDGGAFSCPAGRV